MTEKELLFTIIKKEGWCTMTCKMDPCPLYNESPNYSADSCAARRHYYDTQPDSEPNTVSGINKIRREICIDIYIKRYDKADLMEILL